MSSYWGSIAYFFRLPFHIQWRTFLVQIPRFVPLGVLHITSPKGPHPFLISLPSRRGSIIHVYVFVPTKPVDLEPEHNGNEERRRTGEWKAPVVLDFHGGGFIMGSPLEQAPYASMMSRELGAVVISVSYRIGPFHQFPAAIHDAEDVLSAILDTSGVSKAGNVLRTEIQRYFDMTREMLTKKKKLHTAPHLEHIRTMTLDPTRLAISGFSAGGNIALNMAISVPPCPELALRSPTLAPTNSQNMGVSPAGTMSPLLPPNRAATILDDITQPWPSLLPPPKAQPRMLPLLLFYPSLDARLLPHERPMKPMPSALHGDDKGTEKPRMPGLFSIMGPTYLPRKLRPHPRASPGLTHTNNVQKNAAILLVLPEKDTLAVQSDVWVDKMNEGGWNGPVRFGDGREGDWDGHDHSGHNDDPSVTQENGGLEVWHAPGCRHGWTQFPDTFVPKHEKKERDLVWERTLAFVKDNWRKELPIQSVEGRMSISSAGGQIRPMPLQMPSRFTGLDE